MQNMRRLIGLHFFQNIFYSPRMNNKQSAFGLLVIISFFLASCSYSPIKTFGTYNYGARQMAIGVENSPKDSMVIETQESEVIEKELAKDNNQPAEKRQEILELAATNTRQFSEEIKKLESENETLKGEIQNLRIQLSQISPPAAAQQSTPSPYQASVGDSGEQKQVAGYWLTSSSRKRHNSSCRYYQNSNGKPCGPEEGIPCKICGG